MEEEIRLQRILKRQELCSSTCSTTSEMKDEQKDTRIEVRGEKTGGRFTLRIGRRLCHTHKYRHGLTGHPHSGKSDSQTK